ncbi:ABC-F family ATP-binding cassette domain-containing protein [Hazenella sp. IB182357]|uniref:ABC-F family ATP-binding cassette domain-containing protein n=1 Tax=Polycladospora coralii TaxID=2771432 RepID=A0A926NAU2_9BACL|nr:ABC-F family ATP-binding cassette domain-containing protein [Polycladospora coralii]MBD1373132.1 ABC-F family ATP-binding cassette domain-containing protein [Polycladospora coralii]
MSIVEMNGIKKEFGDRLLLDIPSFKVENAQKIGIVGRNGAGKTTLLRLIAGEEKVDEGRIQVSVMKQWIRQMDMEPNPKCESGGERTKKRIIEALMHKNGLLLADEPTSHLDLESRKWLAKELRNYSGAILLVSHDRYILDQVCTHMIEIEQGKIYYYEGNYTSYVKQKDEKKRRQQYEYDEYQKEKRRLTHAVTQVKQQAQNMKKSPARMSHSEAKLSKMRVESKRSKVSRNAKSIETRLHQLEKKERPYEPAPVQFDFELFRPYRGPYSIRLERLTKKVPDKVLFEHFSCAIPTGAKVGVRGRNGSGKTTLLQAIKEKEAGVIIPAAVKVGYFEQTLSHLDKTKSVLENIQMSSPYHETFIRTVLARLQLKGDHVDKSISSLSGGEQVKVALAKLCCGAYDLLIMDEPTNYLDITTKLGLEEVLSAYQGTLLFVSHDRTFTNHLSDHMIVLHEGKASFYRGNDEIDLKKQEEKNVDQANRLLQLQHERNEIINKLSFATSEHEKNELELRFQQLILQLKQFPK